MIVNKTVFLQALNDKKGQLMSLSGNFLKQNWSKISAQIDQRGSSLSEKYENLINSTNESISSFLDNIDTNLDVVEKQQAIVLDGYMVAKGDLQRFIEGYSIEDEIANFNKEHGWLQVCNYLEDLSMQTYDDGFYILIQTAYNLVAGTNLTTSEIMARYDFSYPLSDSDLLLFMQHLSTIFTHITGIVFPHIEKLTDWYEVYSTFDTYGLYQDIRSRLGVVVTAESQTLLMDMNEVVEDIGALQQIQNMQTTVASLLRDELDNAANLVAAFTSAIDKNVIMKYEKAKRIYDKIVTILSHCVGLNKIQIFKLIFSELSKSYADEDDAVIDPFIPNSEKNEEYNGWSVAGIFVNAWGLVKVGWNNFTDYVRNFDWVHFGHEVIEGASKLGELWLRFQLFQIATLLNIQQYVHKVEKKVINWTGNKLATLVRPVSVKVSNNVLDGPVFSDGFQYYEYQIATNNYPQLTYWLYKNIGPQNFVRIDFPGVSYYFRGFADDEPSPLWLKVYWKPHVYDGESVMTFLTNVASDIANIESDVPSDNKKIVYGDVFYSNYEMSDLTYDATQADDDSQSQMSYFIGSMMITACLSFIAYQDVSFNDNQSAVYYYIKKFISALNGNAADVQEWSDTINGFFGTDVSGPFNSSFEAMVEYLACTNTAKNNLLTNNIIWGAINHDHGALIDNEYTDFYTDHDGFIDKLMTGLFGAEYKEVIHDVNDLTLNPTDYVLANNVSGRFTILSDATLQKNALRSLLVVAGVVVTAVLAYKGIKGIIKLKRSAQLARLNADLAGFKEEPMNQEQFKTYRKANRKANLLEALAGQKSMTVGDVSTPVALVQSVRLAVNGEPDDNTPMDGENYTVKDCMRLIKSDI